MMQTDVRSLLVAASATDTIVGGTNRNRLKALTIVYAATGGTVVVKDGTAGAVTLFSFPAPTAIGSIHILIPGEGIMALTSLAVTTGAGATVIVYYG
jgi:hypothetical protein